MSRMKREKGAAVILFLLLSPVLLGIMIFCLESSRYLQTRATLGDAAEAATLAISARESDNSFENERLAKAYLTAYLGDIQKVSTHITPLPCSDNPDCDNSSGIRFNEFRLKATGHYQSWFSTGTGLSFEKEVALIHSATARKYLESSAVDVFFIADFSGSMNGYWKGGTKISMLKDVLSQVADRIEADTADSTNKNTMALIPFQGHTQDYIPEINKGCLIMHIEYKGDYQKAVDNLFTKGGCIGLFTITKDYFHDIFTILPTTEARVIKQAISIMNANGGTASFEGIIRAAQLARNGKNSRRLFIILSDGVDNDLNARVHSELLDRNYCDRIRKEITRQKTDQGQPVQMEIVVIGFDYNLNGNTSLHRCADKNKVFSAENPKDVYRKVISVIGEDIGHLYKGE